MTGFPAKKKNWLVDLISIWLVGPGQLNLIFANYIIFL